MLRRPVFRLAPSPALAFAVSRSVAALQPGDLLFVDEPQHPANELDNAIRTVGTSTIDWLERRGARVAHRDTAVHVALVKDGGQEASIIEAVREIGVRQISLPNFLHGLPPGCRIFHGKLQGITHEHAHRAVAFASEKIGLPYSGEYVAPTPSFETYYCSSLIDYAFREALGSKLVFTDEPFPLLFEPICFWEAYYQERQKTVPSRVGSNPTLLLHSLKVKYYETAFGSFASSRRKDISWNLDVEQYLLAIENTSPCNKEHETTQDAQSGQQLRSQTFELE